MADIHKMRLILLTVASLLALLTIGAVTVPVTTRMAARARQTGILKAVGVTPGQAVAISLIEYLSLGTIASCVGLLTGPLLAGLLTRPVRRSLGAEPGFLPGWSNVLTVVSVTLAVVALAAARPAWSAVRHFTLANLDAVTGTPRHSRLLARLGRVLHLPLPAALGMRSTGRRLSRTVQTGCSITIAVTTATATLAAQRTFMLHTRATAPTTTGNTLADLANKASDNQLRTLVYLFAIVFAVLATVNLTLVAVFAARDTAHNHAVLRAVGFTPNQTVSHLVTSQVITAIPATAAGIPIGLLLFHDVYTAAANGSSDGAPANPPTVWPAILAATVMALTGLLAAAPARALARRAIAPLLTTD